MMRIMLVAVWRGQRGFSKSLSSLFSSLTGSAALWALCRNGLDTVMTKAKEQTFPLAVKQRVCDAGSVTADESCGDPGQFFLNAFVKYIVLKWGREEVDI